MILTVTMNPAIDISYPLETLALDTTNRVNNETKTAGGKGLNVSRVLHLLGEEVIATGLIGGHIGSFIESRLTTEGISHQFYQTEQESRICLAILHDDSQQTEILEGGPVFNATHETEFLSHYSQLLDNPTLKLVTISGSLPQGISTSVYSQMISQAAGRGIRVLLDCSGQALKESITGEMKPFLIKPNEDELKSLLNGATIESEVDLIAVLSNEQFQEIPWVVVSLGAKGALAKVGSVFYRVTIPKITAINPVGSGDATVAGLAASLAKEESVETVLKTAMTTGILNTLEKQTGFVNAANFSLYYDQVIVEKI